MSAERVVRLVDVDTGLRGNAGPVLVVSEGSRCSVLVAGLVSAFFCFAVPGRGGCVFSLRLV